MAHCPWPAFIFLVTLPLQGPPSCPKGLWGSELCIPIASLASSECMEQHPLNTKPCPPAVCAPITLAVAVYGTLGSLGTPQQPADSVSAVCLAWGLAQMVHLAKAC